MAQSIEQILSRHYMTSMGGDSTAFGNLTATEQTAYAGLLLGQIEGTMQRTGEFYTNLGLDRVASAVRRVGNQLIDMILDYTGQNQTKESVISLSEVPEDKKSFLGGIMDRVLDSKPIQWLTGSKVGKYAVLPGVATLALAFGGNTLDAHPDEGIVYHTVEINKTGDVNIDGSVNIGDAIYLLQELFDDPVKYPLLCAARADMNQDNSVDLSDAIDILLSLFTNYEPPEPYINYGILKSELPCSYANIKNFNLHSWNRDALPDMDAKIYVELEVRDATSGAPIAGAYVRFGNNTLQPPNRTDSNGCLTRFLHLDRFGEVELRVNDDNDLARADGKVGNYRGVDTAIDAKFNQNITVFLTRDERCISSELHTSTFDMAEDYVVGIDKMISKWQAILKNPDGTPMEDPWEMGDSGLPLEERDGELYITGQLISLPDGSFERVDVRFADLPERIMLYSIVTDEFQGRQFSAGQVEQIERNAAYFNRLIVGAQLEGKNPAEQYEILSVPVSIRRDPDTVVERLWRYEGEIDMPGPVNGNNGNIIDGVNWKHGISYRSEEDPLGENTMHHETFLRYLGVRSISDVPGDMGSCAGDIGKTIQIDDIKLLQNKYAAYNLRCMDGNSLDPEKSHQRSRLCQRD